MGSVGSDWSEIRDGRGLAGSLQFSLLYSYNVNVFVFCQES